MAWKDSLLDASFRGVVFDCISTDDEVARATAEHSYPYKNGGNIEDFGNEPRAISIQAIFFGDNYEAALKTFVTALDMLGSGDFVHPIFGSFKAQVVGSYKISHSADNVDQASVSVQFKQDSSEALFFNRTLPIQKAAAIAQALNTARAAAGNVLQAEVAKISLATRLDALRASMTSALNGFRSQVVAVITSGLDMIAYPLSFASDIGALVNGIVDLRGFNTAALMSDWRYVAQLLSTPIFLTPTGSQSARDVALIASFSALQQATAKADAVQIVLSAEAALPSLSAPEIELMLGDARNAIEASIITYRSLYALEAGRPVVEALKTTALALQEAARAIIEARPPLITKTVDAPGNFRLLAHKFYGDHSRADELWRLNKQIRLPNFIGLGDKINAYAQ